MQIKTTSPPLGRLQQGETITSTEEDMEKLESLGTASRGVK